MLDKIEQVLELGGIKKDIILLAISAMAIIFSLTNIQPFFFDIAWIAIVLCGIPILLEAIIGIVRSFDIKADVLVSIALIASICIHEDFAAGEVAFIMQLGTLLEDLTVARARQGIEKLVNLTPQKARIIKDNQELIVNAQDVSINDTVRVLPGESIPVDGVIINGTTSINQAIMTGESIPVDLTVGDNVFSGCENLYGSFEMKALKVGEDSSIQRMIKLVQDADASKAKIVGVADRWATWIVVIALSAALLTWQISGQIIRAVTILVVFCPCALVLAIPTAIMAAIGNATKHGFLVKQGDALERLSKVNIITFDKTGTLTYGQPQVIAIKSLFQYYSDEQIYQYIASCEQYSEHPLAKAIRKTSIQNDINLLETKDFKMIPSRGVKALVNNKQVVCGNTQLLKDNDITCDIIQQVENYIHEGCNITYIAIDQKLVGYIVLADTLRKESPQMIQSLSKLNISSVLLTGDHENAAQFIVSQLNINDYKSNCLPQDKLNIIDNYQKENHSVCMIGDGINDAPALKKADVGIAMGGIGSDISIDAADIVFVEDEINQLPHLVALSKRMMKTIKINMTFSMALNFIAIILAIIGTLNPIIGALVHNAGSVLVITNSALLLNWKGEL